MDRKEPFLLSLALRGRKGNEKVQDAFFFMMEAHQGQTRDTGEPYLVHPLGAARIVCCELGLTDDVELLQALLLHDILEDTRKTERELLERFGEVVTGLVVIVTKPPKPLDEKPPVFQAVELSRKDHARRIYVQGIADYPDWRAILVKLADALHNLRTLDPRKPEKRKRVKEKVLFYYLWLVDVLIKKAPDQRERAKYLRREILLAIQSI